MRRLSFNLSSVQRLKDRQQKVSIYLPNPAWFTLIQCSLYPTFLGKLNFKHMKRTGINKKLLVIKYSGNELVLTRNNSDSDF